MLKYRTRFDSLFNRRDNCVISVIESYNDLNLMKDELICLYQWMDECIDECGLTNRQKEILELYVDESTEEEIAKELNLTHQSVFGILYSACKKISDYSKNQWKNNYVLWGIKKVETNYKKCSRCEEFLPVTLEVFRKRSDTNDGFMYICRKCE